MLETTQNASQIKANFAICGAQAERLVAAAHEAGTKLRIVGSALSPNGIALSQEPMISLGLCDQV